MFILQTLYKDCGLIYTKYATNLKKKKTQVKTYRYIGM